MSKLGLFFIFLLMVIGLVAFFISTDFNSIAPKPIIIQKEPITVTSLDPQLGSPTAKTTIIEFADFTCPHCRGADIILKELVAKYPTAVRLVWKDFPNDANNPLSTTLAYGGRCAQRIGKFESYRSWAFSDQGSTARERVVAYLANIGVIDPESCLNDPGTKAKVAHTIEEGNSIQIDGTPYIIINDKPYTGPITLEAMETALKN